MITFLRRIWSFARPYRVRLFLGLACGVFYALANGAMLIFIPLVGDRVFPGAAGDHSVAGQLAKAPKWLKPVADRIADWLGQMGPVNSKLGLVLLVSTIPAVMLVRGVFSYLNIYLMNWAAMRAVADLRTKLFGHLQNLSLGFFSRANTGELISRITSDTQVLYSIIGGSFSSMIRDPFTILVLLGGLLLKQPGLTLLSLVVFPACIAPILIYGRKVRKSARAGQAHAASLSKLMHESFTGNRIIKAYNLEEAVLAQVRETTRSYTSNVMRVLRANEIPGQIMEFLGALGIALVFLYVILHGENRMTPGEFLAFIYGISAMYQPIKNVTRLYNQIHQARAASERVFELFDTPNSIVDPPNPVPLNAANADIRFENVDFNYDEKPVLRGIDLTVKAGQLVALVGSSGSGKTTLVNLLPRFYDPQRGTVRIGQTDIRRVSIKDLRHQIALVTQETILFHDTIRRNIALGRPGASNAEIEAAARHANAHEFIAQKPEGYETVAGEKGATLSGGQRQRVSIARAILKDAPILILDEATNALDAEAERVVQAELEKLMQGRTTLCIAHRLSTIQKADLIVVLDQGRIVETGTHAELIRRGGIYGRLYELQFQS
jgi:subfamily B ATP-binding cassette protein MsbA